MEAMTSLELGPKVLMVFEDYAKGSTSSSHVAHSKGIPGGLETPRLPLPVPTVPPCDLSPTPAFPSASAAQAAAPGAGLSHQHQCLRLLEAQPCRCGGLLPGLLHGGATRRWAPVAARFGRSQLWGGGIPTLGPWDVETLSNAPVAALSCVGGVPCDREGEFLRPGGAGA